MPAAAHLWRKEATMATNGLLIEFGATAPMTQETRQSMQGMIEKLAQLKREGSVEEFRVYPIVTGNRTQRVCMIMLEMNHEQLESLVQKRPYVDLINAIMAMGTNVTVNRALTLERMLELSKQVG
jgi:hypothetical protein